MGFETSHKIIKIIKILDFLENVIIYKHLFIFL